MEAIFSDSLTIVKSVVQALQTFLSTDGPDSKVDIDIWSPCTSSEVLRRAIYMGNLPITSYLLSLGADFNTPDCHGTTALNAATIQNCDEIVQLLLDLGARALPCDNIGRTALSSGSGLRIETVERLLRAVLDEGGSLSTPDAANGDGNNDNFENFTVLHHYALSGNLPCVQLFLENGADPLAIGTHGATPLTCALVRYLDDAEKYEAVCKVLIKAMKEGGSNFDTKADIPEGCTIPGTGLTALHLAAGVGAEQIVRLLTKNGADVLAFDGDGCLPLLLALREGYEGVCLCLVREMRTKGYDLEEKVKNICNGDGSEVGEVGAEGEKITKTLLDIAIAKKMEALSALLIECTANFRV